MQQPYTAESARTHAEDHFSALERSPWMMHSLTTAEAAESIGVARKLFEVAMALPVGELLQFSDVMAYEGADNKRRSYLFGALPYVCGCLRILDMEFSHATVGVLPKDVVRKVLESNNPVEFAGAQLTEQNVCIQYRRLALSAE